MGTERKKNEGSGEWREAESFIIEENLAAAEGTMGSFSPARASGITGRVGGCGGLGNEEESMGNFLEGSGQRRRCLLCQVLATKLLLVPRHDRSVVSGTTEMRAEGLSCLCMKKGEGKKNKNPHQAL